VLHAGDRVVERDGADSGDLRLRALRDTYPADGLLGIWGERGEFGGPAHQGKITRTGNEHCRWVLVEAAKHYQYAPVVGEGLKKRQEGQPAEVITHAWKAQQRLHRTYWKVHSSTGCPNKATVAVARKAVGFVWAIMTNQCGGCPTGAA